MLFVVEVAFTNDLMLSRRNYTLDIEANSAQEAVDKVRHRLFDYEYVYKVTAEMTDWK